MDRVPERRGGPGEAEAEHGRGLARLLGGPWFPLPADTFRTRRPAPVVGPARPVWRGFTVQSPGLPAGNHGVTGHVLGEPWRLRDRGRVRPRRGRPRRGGASRRRPDPERRTARPARLSAHCGRDAGGDSGRPGAAVWARATAACLRRHGDHHRVRTDDGGASRPRPGARGGITARRPQGTCLRARRARLRARTVCGSSRSVPRSSAMRARRL